MKIVASFTIACFVLALPGCTLVHRNVQVSYLTGGGEHVAGFTTTDGVYHPCDCTATLGGGGVVFAGTSPYVEGLGTEQVSSLIPTATLASLDLIDTDRVVGTAGLLLVAIGGLLLALVIKQGPGLPIPGGNAPAR